jgi:hypothetical protein
MMDDDDDDKTAVTETVGTKTDWELKLTENTLRFKTTHRKGQANKDDFKLHVKLLITMTKALDSTELRIIDNKTNKLNHLRNQNGSIENTTQATSASRSMNHNAQP